MGLRPSSNPPDYIVTLVATQDIFNQNELQPLGLPNSAIIVPGTVSFHLDSAETGEGLRAKGYSGRGKKSVTRLIDGLNCLTD